MNKKYFMSLTLLALSLVASVSANALTCDFKAPNTATYSLFANDIQAMLSESFPSSTGYEYRFTSITKNNTLQVFSGPHGSLILQGNKLTFNGIDNSVIFQDITCGNGALQIVNSATDLSEAAISRGITQDKRLKGLILVERNLGRICQGPEQIKITQIQQGRYALFSAVTRCLPPRGTDDGETIIHLEGSIGNDGTFISVISYDFGGD